MGHQVSRQLLVVQEHGDVFLSHIVFGIELGTGIDIGDGFTIDRFDSQLNGFITDIVRILGD